MLSNGHKIVDAHFNIAFATPDEAIRGVAVLPGLIQEQLVPCMDDVFDQWGADQAVVRIDRLAVDLGTVTYKDMARVLAQRLEQALNAALYERTPAEQISGAKAGQRIPPHQAALDLMAHYLQSGTVPWTAEKSSPAELNRLLETLIDQAPQTLVAFLRSQTQKAGPVLRRLTRQFKPDLLLRLAARLAPAVAPSLSRLVTALAALHQAATSTPAAHRQWAAALWEDILEQLLLPGSGSITAHTLVANALQAAAARHNISHRRLYQRMTRAWQRYCTTAAGIEDEQLVTEFLKQLASEGTDHQAPQPTVDPWPPLKSKLLDAVVHNRMNGFNSTWPVMVTRFAEPTRQVVRQTAQQSQVRRTIARRFASQQFSQLVVLLEPRHGRFINNVLAHQETLEQAMPRASTSHETMRVHLREFTLAYLLSEGATRFNRKQYCVGVIRGLAARHNMAYDALLEDIHAFFASAVAVGDDTGRQIKEILDEIRSNPESRQTLSQKEKSPPPSTSRATPASMHAGRQHRPSSTKESTLPAPSAAQLNGSDPEKTQPSITFDGQVPEKIRKILGHDITQSGLTTAIGRLAERHPRWLKFLSHSLLETQRDIDPGVWIQHLIRCLQKTDEATDPSMFYQALCRELAAVGPLPQAADGPSGHSERASRKISSQNQTTASDQQVLQEIRTILGRDIRRSGPHASLKRLAERHPRWSKFLSHTLPEMGRGLDPADVIRCLQEADGATAPGVFYQALCRELVAMELLPRATDKPARVSERACCPSPSEDQPTVPGEPVPEEIRAVLGDGIHLSGLLVALKRLAVRHPHWSRLLTHALTAMGRDPDPAVLMQHLIRYLQKENGAPPLGGFYRALYRELAACRSRTHAADGPAPVSSKIRRTWREPDAAAPDQSVFVQNAGLVLVAPYLPRLFGMLGFSAKNRFNSHTSAERAVHMLEFIANERTAAPEFQLVLNKVLCGVATSDPIVPGIDITEKERSVVDSLIRGIIQHWKILGNTSPESLRTSFLQREGYLTLKEDTWQLQVEQRSYDMLLDQLPWSYSIIKHPWMTRMLHVNWRSP